MIAHAAPAADVHVMISAGFYGAYSELGPAFERASGHRLVTTRGPSMGDSPEAIPARLARGEMADVVILDGGAADELGKRGVVRPESKVELARSQIGMVVRAGAAKPDIGSVEAFKSTLLAAKSIAYSDSGSGTYLSSTLFAKLGIADQMAGKSRKVRGPPSGEPVAAVVARGEAELGFQQIPELIRAPGVTFVGAIPAELQPGFSFTGAVTTTSRQPEAAGALIRFLASAGAAPTIAKAGLTPPPKPLVVTGSSTIYPLMSDIARRFERLNPGTRIDVRSGGSAKGIADLRGALSDIAMVSRQLAGNERDLFAFSLCRDGAAIVVHRSNPLKELSSRQLSELLTGKTSDWKQLGARPGAIKLAWRTEGQAIPELLLQHLKLKPGQIRSHSTIFENADAIRFVAGDRNAITVAALGVAERSAKSGAAIKLLAYQGVPASTAAVRDHTYSLSRPLILVTRGIPAGLQKQLIDYAVSEAVTDLHEKHGFVPYQEALR